MKDIRLYERSNSWSNRHSYYSRSSDTHSRDDSELNSLEKQTSYVQEETEALPDNLSFRWYEALSLIYASLAYVVDTASDIAVAYLLYEAGKMWYFGLTVAFVVIPTLTMTFFSLRWYIADYMLPDSPKPTRMEWVARVVLLMLQLGPALRYLESLMYGIRFRQSTDEDKKKKYYRCMTYEDADAALLRLFEAFMEAAPQLLLQIYILAGPNAVEDDMTVVVQVVSCVVSLCSIAWSLAAQQRAMRISLKDSQNPGWPATIVQALWYLFMTGSRMLTLGLFASRLPIHLAAICAFRWVVMTTWIQTMKTEFCDTKLEEVLYRCVLGVVFIFCYFNPENSPTRWRYFFFYLYTFTENTILIGIWYNWVEPDLWYKLPAILAVFLGFFIGIVFMLFYYFLLHPTENIRLSGWFRVPPKEMDEQDAPVDPSAPNVYSTLDWERQDTLPLKSGDDSNLEPQNGRRFRIDSEARRVLAVVHHDRVFGTPV